MFFYYICSIACSINNNMIMSISKSMLIMVGLVLLISCSHCDDFSANALSIRHLLAQQEKDWNRGDIEAYMSAYWQSDSLLFIGKKGHKYGWKTTLENYKKCYPDKQSMGTLKFTILKVEVLSAYSAFVVGKWELHRPSDAPSGHFSLVLSRFKRDWKIIIDHSS